MKETNILEYFRADISYNPNVKFDMRLREIDIGNFITDFDKIREERKKIGKFYYRFPNGESMADVYIRVKQWLAEKPFDGLDHYNILIICHAGTMNVLRMILDNLSVEQFEALPKPFNCEVIKYEFE